MHHREDQRHKDPSAAAELLAIAQAVASELQPGLAAARHVSLDSRLDQDLGLDSLARLELIARLEKAFAVQLPEQVFAEAENVRDLLQALHSGSGVANAGLERTELSTDDELTHPRQAQTLTEVLDWHARLQPDYPHIRLHADGFGDDDTPEVISYAQLRDGALRMASALQQLGLDPGDTVALMLPTDRDYFFSFFGVLYAGGVPVPIYPPVRMNQIEDHMRRQAGILDNARCRYLITVPQAKPLARVLRAQIDSLQAVLIAAQVDSQGGLSLPEIAPSDIAFLQYTSGSTGNPKGVILSHANLLANIRVDGQAIEATARDVFVSWLPLYHDMGLIGAWLGSLYFGAQLIIMSPLAFLARPARWLRALHRYGGTLSAAPNFAYQLCLGRIADDELEGLDLSRWRIAMNGAEAVSPDTIAAFSARFAPYGFAADAMFPVYGLAECSVGLTFPALHQVPRIDRIQRDRFGSDGTALPVAESQTAALRFVSCGHALPQHEIRVVDDDGHALPERVQGRLQFRGPSTTRGYYRNPEATAALFDGDWLESGDLAYLADGELFVTGRSKDMIIRGGRNIYPHELEEAVGDIDGIRTGRVAVFASIDDARQTERLVVLAETRARDPATVADLQARINQLAVELTMMPADDVVLAPPGTVLKTSSGKIRRAACRERYEQGHIGDAQRSPWQQIVRLTLRALPVQLHRLWQRSGGLLYSLYAQLVFHVLAVIATLGVLGLPVLAWRRRLLRGCAHLLARLSGTRLRVQGLDKLPPDERPCLFVANHASYIDNYAVTAALPRAFRFVAKAELADQWLSRTFLQRLDTLFVERHDRLQGVQGHRATTEAARSGDSLFYYPEGTFTRVPGLRAFHLGAFVTSVQSGVPVVPVALRGTRDILPGTSKLVRRGDIDVTIGAAIDPQQLRRADESDWQLALRIRDQARAWILQHCGEADRGHEQVFAPPRQTR